MTQFLSQRNSGLSGFNVLLSSLAGQLRRLDVHAVIHLAGDDRPRPNRRQRLPEANGAEGESGSDPVDSGVAREKARHEVLSPRRHTDNVHCVCGRNMACVQWQARSRFRTQLIKAFVDTIGSVISGVVESWSAFSNYKRGMIETHSIKDTNMLIGTINVFITGSVCQR